MITYRYRIKDSNDRKWLKSIAGKVNHAWNLTQDLKLTHHKETEEWLNHNSLRKQIKVEGLHSGTTQEVIKEYTRKCFQFKKAKLKFFLCK